MRDKNSKFDIAIRDEEKENALDDEYMEKFRVLLDRRDRGEISQDECNRLYEEIDDEYTEACSRLYDEEFGTQSAEPADEKFFVPSSFAMA